MISLIDELSMTASSQDPGFHLPVLLRESISLLRPGPGKIFFDGTVGGGGHSEALLRAGATVIAGDRDSAALAAAAARLTVYGERIQLVEMNYAEAADRLRAFGVSMLDGILLDLGVSSHQFDNPERGFSIQHDGPLDMRMSPSANQPTAADLVNESSEDDLVRIFFEFGQERRARRVAAHLVKSRINQKFSTTGELARAVEKVVPRRGHRHPATRVFQALRLAVNRELEHLEQALPSLSQLLGPGGRFVVITFHSLEDRIVKNYYRSVTRQWIDRPEWPEPRPNPSYRFRLITAHPIEPITEELSENPRARSAKLRAVERIDV